MTLSEKNRAAKYLAKTHAFITKLENNKQIIAMNDLKSIYPLDNRVYYWLRDNHFISQKKGEVIKVLNTPDLKDINNLVKHLNKVRASKTRTSVKKLIETAKNKKADPEEFANLIVNKSKAKGYDLVLNVKLVVTSIEYKL